jgi:UDP-N-acetylglucosamine 3-dehydrogenase
VATGSNGVAYLDYVEQSLRLENAGGSQIIPVEKGEPLKIELTDFLNSIDEGRKPSVDGSEGTDILKISLESSRNNFCSLYEMAG